MSASQRIMEFFAAHPEFDGKFVQIVVHHTESCPQFRGGICNCDPDVELDDPTGGKVC